MRPNNQNDLDEFKRALTMAMRSISKEDELTVSFGAETGSVNGVKARLPLPNKSMSAKQLNSLIVEADSIALFIAHHKKMYHKNIYLKDKKHERFLIHLKEFVVKQLDQMKWQVLQKTCIKWKKLK